MKILVRNLSRNTTADTVRGLFEPFGAVQSCNLVLDDETGRSKGFGFVVMNDANDAKAAIASLNASDLHGARIRVKKAKGR